MDLMPIKTIVDGLPLAAMVVDQSRRLVCLNTLAEEIWGTGLANRHYEVALRNPVLTGAIAECFRDRKTFQTRISTIIGSRESTFSLKVAAIEGEAFQGVLVTFEDVSPLEDVGQMRRDFVANVSHELRTPLTALLGFIETLRGPAKDDARARDRFLGIMQTEASRMNRLVRDLLSLSRVESEERIRPGQQLDLLGTVQSTVKALEPIAEDKGISVNLTAPNGEVMVNGDCDQLNQVFTNLIENAIKYGGNGGDVSVTVTVLDRDPTVRGPAVRVEVTDQGQGIDPIHIPRLTERFYRVDSHRSREMGGTGLGLAIVKHIINRHRGRIQISSALGEGSTFTVTLPRL
ncbi:sensor histidine kinase [Donghicola eburneus]|uniref:sensor histidine kinase n=1 Tax=Donghicola eburneus TaxID=393278 RepID=UPI0008E2350C|nr:ATP-binding protein [Donghicola eburneus]SFQ54737.1 two-component system, OmpR family, phosphate regulon sensor histidine kinase PhoR [Donghicola eburneus]